MRRAAAALLAALAAVAAGRVADAKVIALDAVAIPVSDLDRSIAFYTGVLDFEKVSETELAGPAAEAAFGVFGTRVRVARLRLGDESIEVMQFLAPEGREYPRDARSNDRTFQHVAIIVSDMDKAYARLRAAGVRHASSGPQRLPDWNPNAGGIEAFYFKDPDGHPLEVLHFPAGKGAAKWHATGRLFLGIDHTAIVVSGTAASRAFYGDALGLTKAGESENYGTEQEHLNNVFGAHLAITAMRPSRGPGVEFLDYWAPSDGRAAAAGQRANDLVSVTTVFVSDDVARDAAALRAAGYAWITSGAVPAPGAPFGSKTTVMLEDPDGHFVRLIDQGVSQ